MTITVIVPVLNERPSLPACLDSIRRGIPGARIVVSDGTSIDGSMEWLAAQPDVGLVTSARGKGPQQNAGAALADTDVLLFLHADSELPDDAGEKLTAAFADPKVAGGCFFVRFAERRPRSLHVLAWAMTVRALLLRHSYGDQALFLRRSIFQRVGGFPDWPLFEDYELVRRSKAHGRFAVLSSPLPLSARRFLRHGVWRTVIRVFLLQVGFYCGASPERLNRWFADIRPHMDTMPR